MGGEMKMPDQIVSFFLENRELIAIPIAAILSAYLAATFTEKRERKKQHLKEIKDKVFEPVKEGINRYYLPTLEKKVVNIGIDMKPKHNKFVTEEDYRKANRILEPMFMILSPKEAVLRHGRIEPFGKLPSFVPDSKFYSCAKKKHFPSFMQRWEKFEQGVEGYNKRCLEIAEKIKGEIKNEINLPSYKGVFGGTNTYMCEYDLALFILKKSLQEDYRELLHIKEEPNLTMLYVANKIVAQGKNRQEIKKCEEKVKRLVQREDRREELRKQANALLPEVKVLRDELERLLKQKKLSGKCDYI